MLREILASTRGTRALESVLVAGILLLAIVAGMAEVSRLATDALGRAAMVETELPLR